MCTLDTPKTWIEFLEQQYLCGAIKVSTVTHSGFQTANMVTNSEPDSSVDVSILQQSIAKNHSKTSPFYHLAPLLHEMRNTPTVKQSSTASHLPTV